MNKTLNINEKVDDIPLLLAFLKQMGVRVQSLLDQHFPTHGNRQGLTLGWVAVIMLMAARSQIAVGYETAFTRTTTANGQPLSWTERLLLVRSLDFRLDN